MLQRHEVGGEQEEQMSHLRRAIELIADFSELDALKIYLTMSDADKGKDLACHDGAEFIKYLESKHPEYYDRIPNVDKIMDHEEYFNFDDFAKLGIPDKVMESFVAAFPSYDADSPTYLYMTFIRDVENEWLVHMTDNADAVVSDGFKRGMDDYARLGLTTYYNDKAKPGGFNFAFPASSFDEVDAKKYGSEAVLFRASGIEIYHYGDEEGQVIFLGSTAQDLHRVVENIDGDYYVDEGADEEPRYTHPVSLVEAIRHYIAHNDPRQLRLFGQTAGAGNILNQAIVDLASFGLPGSAFA